MTKSIQLLRNDLMDRLEDYIQEQQLPPETRLPSERELCELWKCNRVTLRTAIRKLVDEGRLYRLQGSGTYLAAPKIERNLWQFCSFGEAMRAGGHELSTHLVAFACMEAPKLVAEALEILLGATMWRLERLRIVDGRPLALETAWVPVALAPTLDRYDLERESLYATLEEQFGIRLLRSSQALSCARGKVEEASLLQVEDGTDLLLLEGTAFDQRDRPVEFSRALTRGDRCRLTMRVGKGAGSSGDGR